MFNSNGKITIPVSGGTPWVQVPMNSNYPSQEIWIDGNKYAPVSEVNKPHASVPIISNANTSVVQTSRVYNPTSLYVDGLSNTTPESRMNYYIKEKRQAEEEAKRQQEALITANINKQLDRAASEQYNIMDKLYIEGGLDAMRKEYYRLSAGTEGYNSVYARAAYNALSTKEKEEKPIIEATTNAANKYYNEGGIEGLKHLVDYYKSNGYFNYASVAQSILSTKQKEEATHIQEVTKGANHYYKTGGIESLRHLVKYYGENNYPVYANIAKRILKEKEEQEKLKQAEKIIDKTIEVNNNKINKLRNVADMADDILHKRISNDLGKDFDDKVSKTLKSTFEGVKEAFVETGAFIGEEAARIHLGEKTKTWQKLENINTFFEEEKQRLDDGEKTKTEQAINDVGSYLKKEGELISAKEKTQTEQLINDAFQQIKDTPSDQIAHGIGKFGGEMLIGYGVFKSTSMLVNNTGKIVNAVKTTKRSASLSDVKIVQESLLKEKTLNGSKPIVTQYNNHNANNANAQKALNKKMRALQKAQKTAEKIENLPDGRLRYYAEEIFSTTPGPTRGASYVTEYNPTTGQVRSWIENYDHDGVINRIHPKTIDGQDIFGQHYPPTGKEIKLLNSKQKGNV